MGITFPLYGRHQSIIFLKARKQMESPAANPATASQRGVPPRLSYILVPTDGPRIYPQLKAKLNNPWYLP